MMTLLLLLLLWFTEKHLEEDEELLMAVAASLEGTKAPVESSVDVEAKADEDAKSTANKAPVYLPLPDEPKGSRELLCRIGIRLPDGRRVQRNFLRSDSIKVEIIFIFLFIYIKG